MLINITAATQTFGSATVFFVGNFKEDVNKHSTNCIPQYPNILVMGYAPAIPWIQNIESLWLITMLNNMAAVAQAFDNPITALSLTTFPKKMQDLFTFLLSAFLAKSIVIPSSLRHTANLLRLATGIAQTVAFISPTYRTRDRCLQPCATIT